MDVLVVAVCAVVAGAETFEDIALYGRCKQAWLQGFLALPGGIPSHDTFRRVLMLIDPDAFERCFLAWVREAFSQDPANAPEQIAVDGKAVRHSFDRKRGRSPLHLVSAYATARGLVLAQLATVLATRTIRGINGTGVVTAEIRHYLSSATAPPEALAQAIRRQWTIENGQHWVLDVGFGEDRSRVRERCAARNIAVLRRIALDLLRADHSVRASLKGRRKTAAWGDTCMARLLRG